MIPVYAGHPCKSEPVGYVTAERASELVSHGIACGAKKGKALQIVKRAIPPRTKLTRESLRMITIAAEHGTKCQGGLMNPR
jgi:hypothetical protein